jgi:hypothetical protein
MTNLVFCDITKEIIGRTLTDDEYTNITSEELIIAIRHSDWGLGIIDTDSDCRFTKEAIDKLTEKSAEQLKEFIRENDGMLIRSDEPMERNVFPLFQKGPRKGYPNFKKEPEIFVDRWYSIEHEDECVLKTSWFGVFGRYPLMDEFIH